MKILYNDTKLKELCESEKKLKQKFGQQVADRIIECIQALDASTSLAKVPQRLRPHPREPKHEQLFQIDVLKHKHSTRLFFAPAGTYDILDYTTIEEVEIIDIGKTHS